MLRDYPSVSIGLQKALEQVIQTRRDDQTRLSSAFARIPRDRTGVRAAPLSHSDVSTEDRAGDWLVDATNKYTLVNHGGVLKWNLETLDVGW